MLRKSATLDGEMRSSISNRVYLIGAMILLFVFLIIQIQTGVFSASREVSGSPQIRPQSLMAVLKVSGNQAISVNGARAIDGATILSGATTVTPDQVGARVGLGLLATLDIAPNTTAKPEFDQNGNVKVTLAQGCVILCAGKGAVGEVVTSKGIGGKTNANASGPLEVCFPSGARPGPAIEQNHGGSLFYFARLAAQAMIGGRLRTNIAVGLDDRGMNPGPSSP